MYLRRYLATVLNGIVDVHSKSAKMAQYVQEGIKAASCVKQRGELINEVDNLSREELAQMVEFVIPYMRSAEYNLSPEDLSFMAGNPNQFDGRNVDFRIARDVQMKIDELENNKLALQSGDAEYSSEDKSEYQAKRQKPNGEETPVEREIKKIDRMLYLLNELNCTSSSDLCRTVSVGGPYMSAQKESIYSLPFGGRKTKINKKRKPILKRKQTKRVQRKQTKRAPKKPRKKQTRK
jgi:hypothetical protein